MKTRLKSLLTALLALAIAVSLALPAAAGETAPSRLKVTAEYVVNAVPAPQVGSVGGEWAVLGLARSGLDLPSGYIAGYRAACADYVKAHKGVLSKNKYTEYSRLVLALTALGQDPKNVGGYDLTAPLTDFDMVVKQGVNGAVFALLALDSGGTGANQAREKYIEYILDKQLNDGGWALSGGSADPDATAMAMQALAKYSGRGGVKTALDAGINRLSLMQNSSGGFESWGAESCESIAQAIVALGELGIDVSDPRFIKNGKGLIDALLSFQTGDGGFRHSLDGSVNQMATEQALCALSSVRRQEEGGCSLYRMANDAPAFSDIVGDKNKGAIEALAQKGIINGMGGGLFMPETTMTRAQYAAIIARALELEPKYAGNFSDVPAERWYSGYVDAAFAAGIVKGVGGGKFSPEGTITRQEAVVMTARAAELCGLDTGAGTAAGADYSDADSAAPWAREALDYCASSGIFRPEGQELLPGKSILRGEVAGMLYKLLTLAKRL